MHSVGDGRFLDNFGKFLQNEKKNKWVLVTSDTCAKSDMTHVDRRLSGFREFGAECIRLAMDDFWAILESFCKMKKKQAGTSDKCH
jgi:hypothetical protein